MLTADVCSRTVTVPEPEESGGRYMVRTCDPLGVNEQKSENTSHFNDHSREYIANGNATNSTFPYHSRTDLAATVEALTGWLANQTDQAIISHTLILLNSLKRGASLSQIAENFSHWEAAVRAGR